MGQHMLKSRVNAPLQLLVLTILPLTVLLVAIVGGSTFIHQRAMRTLVGERDQRTAVVVAAAIDEQLKQSTTVLKMMREVDETDPLTELFDHGVGLFSSNGHLIQPLTDLDETRPWWSVLSEDVDDSEFIVWTAVEEEQPLIIVHVPVEDDDMMFAAAFDPSRLIEGIVQNALESTADAGIFVVADSGETLYYSNLWHGDPHPLNQHVGAVAALNGESGTLYLSVDGEERVVAYSPIPSIDGALVIEESWETVADPLLSATEYTPLLLIPVVLIAAVALWFMIQQIVRPLQKLAHQATALGWGEFGQIQEPVGGINEIGLLQTELIHMAQKVKLGQENLRSYLSAVTQGQEEERRRLARELHDSAIQSLVALHQRLQMARAQSGTADVDDQLHELETMAHNLIAELRRVTHALRPSYLEDLGLVPALQMLVNDKNGSSEISITFEVLGSVQRLQPDVELSLYRMAQEALNNVIRHSEATEADVYLTFGADRQVLTIEDNGVGFQVPESPTGMAPKGHFGLLGLHERSELIGARLTVDSKLGEGTVVKITVLS